jgi:alpha-tubulin suppressor-like RCC1 family protein
VKVRPAVVGLALASGILLLTATPAAVAAPLTGATQVAADQDTSCVRLNTGRARCWGYNGDGQVGNGTVVTPVTRPSVVKNPAGTGPLTGVRSVDVGGYISCAVLTTGQARCWGGNDSGQIGDGTIVDPRRLPRVVRNPSGSGPLTGVVQIAAGDQHTCALLGSGQVRCWGHNAVGELGTGGPSPDRRLPQVVLNRTGTGPLTGVAQIDVASQRTCARLRNGQARCWGNNDGGALGNASDESSGLPVVVKNTGGTGPLTGVSQLSVGDSNVCARLTNGQARCWGYNSSGQVGDGTSGTDRTIPTVVRNVAGTGPLQGVTQIDLGNGSTCARLGNGQVRCWGNNVHGQVGDGTSGTNRLLPVVVTNPAGSAPLANVTQLQVGATHVCARVVGGELRCWGRNDRGQVGDGTSGTDRLRPRRVIA